MARIPQIKKAKWTSSKTEWIPLVRDQAKHTAPTVGPMALKPEERDMPKPFTRPRCDLRVQRVAVKSCKVEARAVAMGDETRRGPHTRGKSR